MTKLPQLVLGLAFLALLGYIALDHTRDLDRAAERRELNIENDSARAALVRVRDSIRAYEATEPARDTVYLRIRAATTSARASADSVSIATDALRTALTASATVRDSLTASLAVVASQGAEIASLRMALDSATILVSLLEVDRDRWRGLAQSTVPVMEQAGAALEAERDARACRLAGTVKVPCLRLPGFVADGLKVGAGMALGLYVGGR